MLYMANGEISPTRCKQLRLLLAMALLYRFRAPISPIIRSTYAVYGQWWNKSIKCNNCVFILRNDFTRYVSGYNLTHHQEYICCIWPMVK